MKEKLKLYGAVFVLVIFIPYLLTVYFQGDGLLSGSASRELSDMEKKVIRIVSEEMSGSCETEALKAQAVIARTNLYQDPDMEIKENEDNLKENLDRITFCVEDTKGEILTYKGEPIDAAYHAISSKQTRNAAEVPGQEDKDYLAGVDSSVDIGAEDYLHISYMDREDMAEKLQPLLEDEKIDPEKLPDSLKIEERDSAGYVTKIQYGDITLNGEAVREALDLPSSCFYFSLLDDRVRITVKGLGHGLGMSQYGANEMAKGGKDYKDILNYYYKNVQIEEITESSTEK